MIILGYTLRILKPWIFFKDPEYKLFFRVLLRGIG